MPKFLHCLMCDYGFPLELGRIETCKWTNVGGMYIDQEHAVLCAKNPEMARFIGINGENSRFLSLICKFCKIDCNDKREEWERDNLVKAHTKEQWEKYLLEKGYSVGTVMSLKEKKWPKEWKEKWEYDESLCGGNFKIQRIIRKKCQKSYSLDTSTALSRISLIPGTRLIADSTFSISSNLFPSVSFSPLSLSSSS